MRFKLDENFGTRCQDLFKNNGHDVETVVSENLQGCGDQTLYDVCRQENRCLVTLDMDFANVLRFPPEKTRGMAVIRVPQNPSLEILELMVQGLLSKIKTLSLEKKLWIVEIGRIRIHDGEIDLSSGPAAQEPPAVYKVDKPGKKKVRSKKRKP